MTSMARRRARMARMIFSVAYEPDGNAVMATVLGKPNGCHCVTHGKDLTQAKERIRDALATALDDEVLAKNATLHEIHRASWMTDSVWQEMTERMGGTT